MMRGESEGKRMRYLDTSSLRKLGGKLNRVSVLSECKTSALALIELLNGLRADETAFKQRSSPVRSVMTSGVRIEWESVEARMTAAFPALSMKDSRVQPLKTIVDAVSRAATLQAFLEANSQITGPYDLTFFENYDGGFGGGLREAVVDGSRKIKAAFEAAKTGKAKTIFDEAMLKGSFDEFCGQFARDFATVNHSATVLGLAHLLATYAYDSPTDKQVSDLYANYNGSLQIFVAGMSYAMVKLHGRGGEPKRNDAQDLAHLIYLDTGDSLVTEDIGLRTIAEAVGIKTSTAADLGTVGDPGA
jgi:hypothetical protein